MSQKQTVSSGDTALPAAPVVTIDGPSGSGKGLLSATLAQRSGWHVLDSGALYRLVALSVIEQNLNLDDDNALRAAARELDALFFPGNDGIDVTLNGRPVAQRLRHEDVGAMASQVAALGAVREALLQRQRDYRQAPGLIADGRDMGTVVFPDAPLKVFLTASAEERARRRWRQLLAQGENVNFNSLLREIEARDQRDQNRPLAPLRPADDAVVIDSTAHEPTRVVEQVYELMRDKHLLSTG